MWLPAMASLVGLALASPEQDTTLESSQVNPVNEKDTNLLVCRCGMDSSDPKSNDANSKCRRIQYHKDSRGIEGNYSGVHIVNDTACAIDLKIHPKGVCKKDVYVDGQSSGFVSRFARRLLIVHFTRITSTTR